MLHPLRNLGPRDLADRPPRLEHGLGLEAHEVRQDEQVGLVTGCDRAHAPQAMPDGRVPGCEHDRVLGCDARGDRLPHHAVDVAVRGDVLGVAVVGAERDVGGSELGDEW